jgi:YidC/Oxa1 family membrane protein insertase
MFDGFFEIVSQTLNFFYELVPNYAIAIALLTLVVMVITTPLTLKGTRSMIEMQRLQPEMRKLQVQYKDDRQKLNEEMMKFYREHEINPLGGCFPLLIQAPVFSILFYVVRGLTNESKFVGVQRALGEWIPNVTLTDGFRPKYLDHEAALYQDLLGKDHMNAFGVDLARSASEALSAGFLEALPYIGLVAVIALLSWYQQRQIMGRNPNSEMTSQQRMMMRIGPAMYVFFAFVSPMAIGVYFLVSTLWRVGQQGYITRSLYRGEDSVGAQAQKAMAEVRATREKDGSGGGFLGALTGGANNGGRSGGRAAGGRAAGAAKSGAAKSGGAKAGAKGTTKAPAKGTKAGSGTRAGAGKAASGSGAKTTQNGSSGPVPTAKPHPRSRKKKKRK